jgi:hypothetical protein
MISLTRSLSIWFSQSEDVEGQAGNNTHPLRWTPVSIAIFARVDLTPLRMFGSLSIWSSTSCVSRIGCIFFAIVREAERSNSFIRRRIVRVLQIDSALWVDPRNVNTHLIWIGSGSAASSYLIVMGFVMSSLWYRPSASARRASEAWAEEKLIVRVVTFTYGQCHIDFFHLGYYYASWRR